MAKNDTINVVDMQIPKDVAFIIKAGEKIVPIEADYQMQSDEVLVANAGAKFVVMKNGIPTIVNESCPTCIIMSEDGLKISELSDSVSFSAEGASNANFSLDDIAAIQDAILAGDDPTETIDTAAGNEAQGSSNSSFVVIDYDNNELLAQAGFDTASEQQETRNEDESLANLTAEGGNAASISLVEGDLGDNVQSSTYPVVTTQSVTIEAGTQPLNPDSFTFDSLTLDNLLSELNSDITSGGESIEFVFDSVTNSIIGTHNGELVLTIDLDTSSNGPDVTVNITTTLHQPIDHGDGTNSSGLVTNIDDQININVSIQGADASNNKLNNPISIDISIADGIDPSFSTDSGVTVDETTQKGDVISGQIPLDVGSDEIATIEFQSNQPSLAGMTSNGEATTFTVVGNTLTVVDSVGKPVMTVTVATDGSYEVTVTGPVDQVDSESTNIDLNVTATDKDGDSTDGSIDITITDGGDAGGNGTDGNNLVTVTLNEGDLDVAGDGVNLNDIDTTYPASQSGSFVIQAGEDRLVPDSIAIDPALQDALITELQNELTSGGEKLTFTVDGNGNLVGKLPSGDVAVTVSLAGEQQGQDVKVSVTITQNVSLDHNGSDTAGYMTFNNDEIHINVPVQVTDTDGDDLDTAANVDITITDGANPSFGTDSGVTINESTDENKVIEGQIPLNVGSDEIATIVFQSNQPSLAGITSNGQAATFTVVGNTLTVLDSADKPVMTVIIATDGSYKVTVTGPVDQKDASDKVNIDLNVTATDKDGDTTDGLMDITITDGINAAGKDQGAVTLTEGDLDVAGDGVNPSDTDTSYPASQSGSFVIKAGEDRLVPGSIKIDPALQSDLIAELQAELTSGGEALTFSVDSDGNLVGALNGVVAVTVSLSGEQQGQDVKVTVTITQHVPLDHTNTGDTGGYITSANDEIHINVPVQATDTDGDDLDAPANVDITITDGANPSFGTDSGVTINESTEKGNTISGQIPLDVGSDAIDSIVFQAAQPGLTGITSNGAVTTFTVVDNILTVLDNAGDAVMTVTIATDGSYQVIVTGPVDQSDSELTNINLGVTATDNDGDSTDGTLAISLTDGSNAAGGDDGVLTLAEGDLDVDGNGVGGTDTTYPASQSGSFVIQAGEDRLVPDSI
ncbi:retention module-containing protein, partial [Moritella sp. Urea-trap-13]|uniref:retention module-containing protein n=1 Tax=Moritella sp. Urea-trap-13 TaxID=2058327 RepID=UPI0012FEC264